MVNYIILAFIIFLLFYKVDEKFVINKSSIAETNVVKTARDSAIEDYNQNYIGSAFYDNGWTGNVAKCKPGTISESAKELYLKRINYFRRQVGLNDDINWNPNLHAKCQAAALMMLANNNLSHTPPKSWKCYTEDGYRAASTSNLSWGLAGNDALTDLMNDEDKSNYAVGHRRWILYSNQKTMGIGATTRSCVLWIMDFPVTPNTKIPTFIAWPNKGYIAKPLLFSRWSFAIPKADFKDAVITMKSPTGNVTLMKEQLSLNCGDNTIVWKPNIDPSTTMDTKYTVKITNVKLYNGQTTSFNYDVIVFNLEK